MPLYALNYFRKHSDTRIKPLTLANGHGRYMTVTPERTLASVGPYLWGMSVKYIDFKFLSVSLPKRPCNGRFNSETAIWIHKWFKKYVGTSRRL